ncbi:transposase [Austwickia sp. TVS 96-490-7B]|uniref:transposase n=1 Tax=Austwickia sp. TVS 96-490-7B TaxID=2830843 RepID=UPI001C56870A
MNRSSVRFRQAAQKKPSTPVGGFSVVQGRCGERDPRQKNGVQKLRIEIDEHDHTLARLVTEVNPALIQAKGIGAISTVDLLIAAGDNPERITGEAAFATLCGACPLPASSGKITRHRLNRAGNRTANCALHRITVVRLHTDPRTRAYAAPRRATGKSTHEILRFLKRAIVREVYHLTCSPTRPSPSTPTNSDRYATPPTSPSRPPRETCTGPWPRCPTSNAATPPTTRGPPPTSTTSPTTNNQLTQHRSIPHLRRASLVSLGGRVAMYGALTLARCNMECDLWGVCAPVTSFPAYRRTCKA